MFIKLLYDAMWSAFISCTAYDSSEWDRNVTMTGKLATNIVLGCFKICSVCRKWKSTENRNDEFRPTSFIFS